MARGATNPLLATRDGRLFLGAQALDFVAQGAASVALPWLILDGGGSNLEAGLVFTLTMLPYVVFGLPAGVVGDRFRRRRVMYIAHAVQAAAALVIPLWSLTGHPPLGVVLVAAFCIGSGRVFADAAAFGAIAAICGREAFTRAQATLQAAWSAGFLVGPALGGVLIGVIGPARTLAVEAASFLVAIVLIALIRVALDPAAPPPVVRAREAMREGVAIIYRNPALRAYTTLAFTWNFCAAGSFAQLVPLLREEIGLPSGEVGLVVGIGAGTGMLAGLVAGPLAERYGPDRLVRHGIALNGLAIGLLGVSPGVWLAASANAFRSLGDWVMVATFIGERQRRAPDHLQARVGISGRMLIITAISAGSLVSSLLTQVVELRALYVGMGLATVVVALVLGPPLRRAVLATSGAT